MQLHCNKCGHDSPDTDKFCRFCGAQLKPETEFTSAPTLNHGKVEPQGPSLGTGRLPPSIGDITLGETGRMYYAPQYVPGPPPVMAQPQMVVAPAPQKHSVGRAFSGFFKGLMILLLFGGLLAATASAVFFSQEARRERDRRNDVENRRRDRGDGNYATGRAQDAWDQMEEALNLMQEASEKAATVGAEITSDGQKPVDLSKYAYPDARTTAAFEGSGKEMLSQISREKFETVRSFYEKQFGKPVIQAGQRNNGPGRNSGPQKLLFQSTFAPTILVKIEDDRGPGDQVKITILRSLFHFPRFDAAQSK
jgi:hypothetical protein